MNVNKVLTKDYENKTLGEHGKNEPNTNPIKPNFRGKKMLLRLTINTRRVSLCYYADEIEAPNAYDREKAGNRINGISAAGLLYFPIITL